MRVLMMMTISTAWHDKTISSASLNCRLGLTIVREHSRIWGHIWVSSVMDFSRDRATSNNVRTVCLIAAVCSSVSVCGVLLDFRYCHRLAEPDSLYIV